MKGWPWSLAFKIRDRLEDWCSGCLCILDVWRIGRMRAGGAGEEGRPEGDGGG